MLALVFTLVLAVAAVAFAGGTFSLAAFLDRLTALAGRFLRRLVLSHRRRDACILSAFRYFRICLLACTRRSLHFALGVCRVGFVHCLQEGAAGDGGCRDSVHIAAVLAHGHCTRCSAPDDVLTRLVGVLEPLNDMRTQARGLSLLQHFIAGDVAVVVKTHHQADFAAEAV